MEDLDEEKFKELNTDQLKELQTAYTYVIQIFLEEMSMLTPGVLGYVDYR